MTNIKDLRIGDRVRINVLDGLEIGHIESIAPRYSSCGDEYTSWKNGCIVKFSGGRKWRFVKNIEKVEGKNGTLTNEAINNLDVGDVYKDEWGDVCKILEVKGWTDDGNKRVLVEEENGYTRTYNLTESWVKEIIEKNGGNKLEEKRLKALKDLVKKTENLCTEIREILQKSLKEG